jgi:hypothetical protein
MTFKNRNELPSSKVGKRVKGLIYGVTTLGVLGLGTYHVISKNNAVEDGKEEVIGLYEGQLTEAELAKNKADSLRSIAEAEKLEKENEARLAQKKADNIAAAKKRTEGERDTYRRQANAYKGQINTLDAKVISTEEQKLAILNTHPSRERGYRLKEGRKFDALTYVDETTDNAVELARRETTRDKIDEKYDPSLIPTIEQKIGDKKLGKPVYIRPEEDKIWNITIIYSDGKRDEFDYRDGELINTGK